MPPLHSPFFRNLLGRAVSVTTEMIASHRIDDDRDRVQGIHPAMGGLISASGSETFEVSVAAGTGRQSRKRRRRPSQWPPFLAKFAPTAMLWLLLALSRGARRMM